MEKSYTGKIKQNGQQTVKAPAQAPKGKRTGVVKKGDADLRCGK